MAIPSRWCLILSVGLLCCLLGRDPAAAQHIHTSTGYIVLQQPGSAAVKPQAAEGAAAKSPSDAAPPEEPQEEAAATTAEEEPAEEAEEEGDGPRTLFPAECETRIGGWVQAGYHSGSDELFNDRPDTLNLHQSWLWIENSVDGENGLDIGYRADILYGIDGADTQAFGNPPGPWDFQNGWDHGAQSWAMPQLYGQFAYCNLSAKIGHFYTPVGYEVVQAPGNFFYSHALTHYNTEPFTHTGVLTTYKASEQIEVYAGWTLGWDTGFERLDGGSNWLGGVAVQLAERLKMTYMSTAGDLGWRGEGYSHSLIFDWTISDRWHYVFESDMIASNGIVAVEDGVEIFQPGISDDQIGINQYLFYTISPKLAAGVRAEWWKSDGVSFNEVTYGVNLKPHPNFVVRPEVRHQWCPTDEFDFEDRTVFGIDGYVTF
ncbi:MAG: porin [Pirellulales bacterium]|nr:porin [Pirellulales bacterium]